MKQMSLLIGSWKAKEIFGSEESGNDKEKLIVRTILKIPGLSEIMEKFVKLHQEDQNAIIEIINRFYYLSMSKFKNKKVTLNIYHI
ncbi:hypothetical protein LEP1GSC083_0056 [Leptospira interrogans serovar Pyrogenes str. L0374]|uniref:Uncharacterized protein n=1 Tax=Leptospira interrogans serovar Pyrogenes str. L0374 TaxID=1049928 RepID=M6KBE3_LEPIR|nr:hypothetical protein LEP1GSC083_0056 [Leptospira interrogans serovar Pyrogenes str. L0374]